MIAVTVMPRKQKQTRQVRLDVEVVRMATTVANLRDISLPDYLLSVLSPVVADDFARAIAEENQRLGRPKPKRAAPEA